MAKEDELLQRIERLEEQVERAPIAQSDAGAQLRELVGEVKQLVGIVDDYAAQAKGRHDQPRAAPAAAAISTPPGRPSPVQRNVLALARAMRYPADPESRPVPFPGSTPTPQLRPEDPILPVSAGPGDEVKIFGRDLDRVRAIRVDGSDAAIERRSPDVIVFVVPEDASKGKVAIEVDGAPDWTLDLDVCATA